MFGIRSHRNASGVCATLGSHSSTPAHDKDGQATRTVDGGADRLAWWSTGRHRTLGGCGLTLHQMGLTLAADLDTLLTMTDAQKGSLAAPPACVLLIVAPAI